MSKTKEEREALDAKVLDYVSKGLDVYDAASIDGVATMPEVSAALARLKRASKIRYEHVGRVWRVNKTRGPGRARKVAK